MIRRTASSTGLAWGRSPTSEPTSQPTETTDQLTNQPTTEHQLPAHCCSTASLSPARPSSILTARSGTPNRRTAERPSLTAGARKERTEVTPQRDTPGKLGMSCLHTRDTRDTRPTRKPSSPPPPLISLCVGRGVRDEERQHEVVRVELCAAALPPPHGLGPVAGVETPGSRRACHVCNFRQWQYTTVDTMITGQTRDTNNSRTDQASG